MKGVVPRKESSQLLEGEGPAHRVLDGIAAPVLARDAVEERGGGEAQRFEQRESRRDVARAVAEARVPLLRKYRYAAAGASET